MAKVNLTINNQPVAVDEGLTIMEAARENKIDIPSLCYLQGKHQMGACRICVVEVDGMPTMPASCTTLVREGMVVRTNTKKVRSARKVLFELMLSDHSQDCLSCTRNQSCEFQALGRQLGVDTSRFEGERSPYTVDASYSITRDMSKCILCRRCVTACSEIQQADVLSAQGRGFGTEISPSMNLPLGEVNCTYCGQCTAVCPVGALKATSAADRVWAALDDPEVRTVVQVAPAVRVALGECFGYPSGTDVTGQMVAALRKMGFDDVFDTNFAADLTIMEEGTEFLHRVQNVLAGSGEAKLPMITSCSPGWIKFAEHHYPKLLDHLSTCKSPHTMLGALSKSYYADKVNVRPKDVFTVSVMPCTAKKTEIVRAEMQNNDVPNVDAVLTTRELGEMIASAGIEFAALEPEKFDAPMGISSGAADIFGLTGGVMEAALRTVYELVTGRELPFEGLHVTPIEGLEQVKAAGLLIENPLPAYAFLDGVEVKVAVTSGLAGAAKLMDQLAKGESPYHFIEVMGCPGGCIMGGGQPRSNDVDIAQKRYTGLMGVDDAKEMRKSHDNPAIQALYKEYLGEPGGHKSHELLHTHYVPRGNFNQLTEERFIVDLETAHLKPAKEPKGGRRGAAGAYLSPQVLELEAENKRLRTELEDALETVDILKVVLSDS